ncbi:hypothetical protein QTP88_011848 [Uroleucon formosanum]
MSDNKSVKRKRNRFKVECLKCGSIFNNDFKKQHEEKVHNGKSINIKLVGAPDNLFQSAAKTSKIIEKRNLKNNIDSESLLEDEFAQNDQNIHVAPNSEILVTCVSQSVPVETDDFKEDEVNWLSCAGKLENIVADLSECGIILSKLKSESIPNPIIFLLESIQIISRIKSNSKEFLKNANILSEQFSKASETSKPVNNIFDNIINHDPGSRGSVSSTSLREYLIALGPHQPKLTKYPINTAINNIKQHSFNPKWYNEYPLLEYSIVTDSVYCFVCSLFSNGPGRTNENSAWVKHGVRQWHKMKSCGVKKLGKLQQHFNCISHKAALDDYYQFMTTENHIDIILNKSNRKEAIKLEQEKDFNKQIIIILFDIARTLSRQGLGFRGDGDENGGNFMQLVKLLSRHNPLMKRWIEESSSRSYKVTYLGPTSQNEFIELLAKETRNIIAKEIKEANIYSVSADTTPDISHQDRLAVCVRYVNSQGKAVERLLEMEKGTDKTGLGTASQIINILESNLLNPGLISFQSYDFASNMSGKYNGAHVKLSELVGHKITFIPCQAHRLNTFLEHSCDASSIIGNTIDTLESLYVFFSSSNKRYGLLHEKISKIENALQLRNLSKARWTARAESVKAVWNSLEAVIESLDEIHSLNKCFDKATRSKALGIRKQILSFDFIVSLSFLKNIMYKLKFLTETLEAKDLCIIDAITVIDSTMKMLTDINSDDHTMNNFIDSAKEFANLLGTDPEADFKNHHHKRLAPKRYDSNATTQAEFTMHLFYRKEFKMVLDTLLKLTNDNLRSCVSSIQPLFTLFSQPFNKSNISLDNVKKSISLFPPSSIGASLLDFDLVQTELEILFSMLQEDKTSFNSLMEKAEEVKHILPCANQICRLALTSPVTVASNERSFSKLKLIKTHLRSTMADERLNSLVVLGVEKDIVDQLDMNKIAHKWSTLKNRRIQI